MAFFHPFLNSFSQQDQGSVSSSTRDLEKRRSQAVPSTNKVRTAFPLWEPEKDLKVLLPTDRKLTDHLLCVTEDDPKPLKQAAT